MTNVSRETEALLDRYVEILLDWNVRINLVGRTMAVDGLDRQITDSVEIVSAAGSPSGPWLDLGSGGGLPGIPAAIITRDEPTSITMMDSDRRKCAFLRAVLRELNLRADVVCARIEDHPPFGAACLTAKALAPLPILLGYARRHLAPDGVAVFPKGARHEEEVAAARRTWHFDLDVVGRPGGGAILRIGGIRNVG